MGKKQRIKLEKAQQAKVAERMERQPLSIGVAIFGILFILSSIVHISKLIGEKDAYFYYYSYLPSWLAIARYAFSWIQRIAGIFAGGWILGRKEVGRKLAFLIGIFTVLTIYWKHPYPAVLLHTQFLDQKLGFLLKATGTGITFASITPVAVGALIATDLIFWAIFFIFFTRPSVRKQFKPG